ncbi:charged multivesicular body protein 3 [Bacillus rossius redtenbacheri]|uniref:charged multivesicular body protein 3 n=1 Tax=Bacillus rossius redtenbacheri TaxID=93214 RepID=UPI002FDDD17A
MGLFSKTPEQTPKEMVNDWSRKIRKEGYQLDRQIRAIQREEEKVKRSLKEVAKKGDKDICIILAKEVLRARKAINKIHISKAHMQSILLQMKNQLATLRVAGSLEKSTEVMQAIQNLIKVPEVAETMRDLSREMMKAGIIEEMLDDTMDTLEDEEELEEEAEGEVDKVLWELTAGALGRAPAAVTDSLPPRAAGAEAAASTSQPAAAPEDEEELEEMQSRLEALRS